MRPMMEIPSPPVAARRPHSTSHHGITIEDPYAWLRDAGYPDVTDANVLAYLNAENAYFEAAMAPHQPLVDALFQEMRGRIKEADESVPQKDGDWLYWRSFDEGAQYRKWWRSPVAGGEKSLILDEPALAEGKEYFRLGGMDVSPDGRLLAYAIDDNGSERFTIRIKDLESGEHLPETIEGTLGAFLFAGDGVSLLYGLVNEHWRIDVAKLHRLGTPVAEDVELYREADEGFQVGLGLTQSRRWIAIGTGDHVTSEVRLLPFDDPTAAPILVAERKPGREYDVEEHDGTLFIRTNDTHTNFRLVTAPVERPSEWTELIAPSADFYLTDVSTFAGFFVVEGREHGLDRIYLHDYAGGPGKQIDFPEASYSAGLDDNPEYEVTTLRLSYESMVTPGTVLDYDVASGARTILKVQEIPSGYDPSQYATERLEIAVRDGTKVPVSIVYRREFARPGPLYLYGYGAYGLAIEPGFSTSRLSLLDRGMAFAIAHIRGGDDLGQQWYLDGKLEKRTNTFNDFVDVARGLVDLGWTEAGRIAIAGGSAGGELMGAAINDAPELWGAVAAHVPFVDVLNTMLDPTLPLTPGEWPEWGNPIEDKAAFELIHSYSPYENVRAQAYPPLLVTAGLNDPRVTYWEPAKWVARLRATKTDANLLLLKTNMGAGHGGKSGRFESLRETAEEFAFILWQVGLAG
ncbi:prolyl oligopeptidase family serine peptidase [Sphingomonas sp. MAH-20]|uniref:Prolyl oligopeptidase family serine peptidase n=2 Tax=Sphingomonadaceae TaxID=41297 RepID=A0A6I4IYY6_9SPHN|nr:prolyl oligopeptidase family serine peptidase [Sphingomonas horti]